MVEDIQDACSGGLDLPGHTVHELTRAVQGDLDFLDIGCQQGQGREGCGSDCESLAGGGGGVAEGIQDVRALTHLGFELAHLGVAACIVCDGAVCVGCEGDSKGGEHTHGCDRHTVQTLRKVGGGEHVGHVEVDGEEVCQDDCACDGDDGDGGGHHSEADAVDDDGGGACLRSLCKLLGGLIGVRSVVLRRLADDHAREQAGDHGAAELPPVLEPEDIEHAEGGDAAEDCRQIGADAHALEELCHAGAFLGADGEDADDGKQHADCRDEHRGEDSLHLHFGADCIECGCAQGHGGEDGSAVALVEVCAHACNVTHVVTDVIGDGGGVAGIVLGEIGLDLTHKVCAHVCGLGVDAAADTCEEGLGGCTHSEGQHGGGDDDQFLGHGGLVHESVQHDEPDGDIQKAKAYHGETHDGTGAERHLQAGVKRAAGCIGRAAGSISCGAHPDEAGKAAEETAGEECEGHPGILDAETVGQDGEENC